MTQLANKHRPRTTAEVVGQEAEVKVVRSILANGWRPSAIMITGPFGTGKTTTARLIGRAMLCDNPQYGEGQNQAKERPYEPCGTCAACRAMDTDSHPNYIEVDAASNGLIADVRQMKDQISYRTGDKPTIITYDESHGLSQNAQNALLQTLEEGQDRILFIFATTDPGKMLPTIKSRCVVLGLKLLSNDQIRSRVIEIAGREAVQIEDKAATVLATYVRGHVRDALVLLEQLSNMVSAENPVIDESMVRAYLRLDRYDEIYQLLAETDQKKILDMLETLLCNYAPSELAESIGQVLVNVFKYRVVLAAQRSRKPDQPEVVMPFTATDLAWITRVDAVRGERCLDQAEAILSLHTDYATINYGLAAFSKILIQEQPVAVVSRLPMPGAASSGQVVPPGFRKPGKEAVTG